MYSIDATVQYSPISSIRATSLVTALAAWSFLCTNNAFANWAIHSELEFGSGENALAIVDVNDDDNADIVVATENRNEFSVLLGNGLGQWKQLQATGAGVNPTSIAVGDYNSDGHVDLLIANHESPHLSLARGDGTGAFEIFDGFVPLDVLPHPHVVGAADLNGDKLLDVIVDSRDQRGVVAVQGLPEGRFAAPGRNYDVGGAPYLGFAIGDINGDELPDLATPNADAVGLIVNQSSSGEIMLSHDHSIPFAAPFAVGLDDFDGDGNTDLVVASERGSNGIAIFRGDGEGNFGNEPVAVFEAVAGGKKLLTGDFDGDSITDIVICSWNREAIVVSKSNDGFDAQKLVLGSVRAPWGMAVGDVDGDGLDDILISDGAGTAANFYVGSEYTASGMR